MPIKPENKSKYPDNWKEIRERIRERAGNKCEWCGVANHAIGYRERDGSFRNLTAIEWDMIHSRIKYGGSNLTESIKHFGFVKIVCTVAHLDHDPTNNDPGNLAFLCQKCHNNYDRKHRNQTIRESKLTGQIEINYE